MAGNRVVNPATGEVDEFVEETPEMLTMSVSWPRPGHRATEHLHPNMEETWRVLDGNLISREFPVTDVSEQLAALPNVVVLPTGLFLSFPRRDRL